MRADLRLRALVALLALFAFVGGPADSAYAHAELVRSDPLADAIIESMTTRVSLWFSEEPELRFSGVQVLDPNGRRVDRGDLRPDPADKLSLSMGVQGAGPGTYSVLWTALSTVDGHVTRGAFAFTVGLDQVPTGVMSGPGETGSTATPDRVLVRFLTYLGLAALVGVFPYIAWVLLTGLALGVASYNTTSAVLHRVWIVALAGGLLVALGSIGLLLTQAAALSPSSDPAALSASLGGMAFGTRFGLLWWVRMALVLTLTGIVILGRQRGPSPLLLRVGMVLGMALLLDVALGSHAAAAVGATGVAVTMDWIHLIAMCTWAGGLLHLLVTVAQLLRDTPANEATRIAARLVPRFSVLGMTCVSALVLTGVYAGWLSIGSPPALIGTPQGQTLLLKLGLIVPLIAVAGVNLLWIRPPLVEAANRPGAAAALTSRLRNMVLAESVLVGGVLLVTGALANLQPGREALLAQGIQRSARAEGVQAVFRVQPGVAGVNRFDVELTDRDGRPITDAEKVALRFVMREMDMGESELVAFHRADGHYVASGGQLIMPGLWGLEAIVRRPGQLDARPQADVTIAAPSPSGTSPAAPLLAEGSLVLGLELLLLGAIALWLVQRFGARRPRVVPAAAFASILALAAGALATGGAIGVLRSASITNPIPPTRDSIVQGGTIYAENCVTCHGESGRGDGPAAFGLSPRPADFRTHLAAGHTDAQLFEWLTNGVSGTAMPAFRDQLREEERWHVLNYLRASFGPGRAPPPR